MDLVILESPFAADHEPSLIANIAYAKECLLDSLRRGEAPIASHLLYPLVLNDNIIEQRQQGIEAGLAWRRVADRAVFYLDRGWSRGMIAARQQYDQEGIPYETRNLF